jgi:hypothetical protein
MAIKAPPRFDKVDRKVQLDEIRRALGDVIAISYDPKDTKVPKTV